MRKTQPQDSLAICQEVFSEQMDFNISLIEYIDFVESTLLKERMRAMELHGISILSSELIDKNLALSLYRAASSIKRIQQQVETKVQNKLQQIKETNQ